MTTADDHALTRDLAEEAGQSLLALRARHWREPGGEPGKLRKAGDRQSHEFLAARLAELRPFDALFSEEGADDGGRLSADRVWIVDPLDGTREFGEEGRTDWAVHVALWERTAGNRAAGNRAAGNRATGDLTAGAVALPAQGMTLSTLNPDPLSRTDSAARAPSAPVRIAVSRSRASRLVKDVAARLGAELVPCGSAGAKAATVITGETDAYLHSGGFYEWDTAAPVAVARAAGLHASRTDGSPLAYNREDPLLPDILICQPAIAGLLLDAIREVANAH